MAYANAAKVAQLGVNPETIERFGAVSQETVREMARGARERFNADIAIATSGIAGPAGGTAEKPVGLVWFALDDGERAETSRVTLSGDREAILQRATTIALGTLWRLLRRYAIVEEGAAG